MGTAKSLNLISRTKLMGTAECLNLTEIASKNQASKNSTGK